MNKRKILALLLAVVMICSLFVSPALAADDEGIVAISDTAAPKFTDVKDHWAESAINRWAEEGIVKGDGDGTVQPARNLRRAELATILTRLLGLKDKAAANTFSDVTANDWYADAVLKCAKAGIMLGDGTGKANPETPITRQEAIVMIGRAVGVKPASGDSLDRFQDGGKVAAWAAPYMIALTNMDILNGLPVDGGFVIAPNEDINRASTFTLLDKAIAKYVTGPSTVTVDDANKFVIINSAAEETGTVTVTGKAAGVVVATGTTDEVVLKNAAVGTVKVDAPVDVIISRGSNVTDLDANAAAVVTNNGTVTNLNTNADDVTFDGNKPSKVNTAEGVKPATDAKGNEVTDKPASSGGSTTPSVVRADVVAAPLADQAQENAIPADQLGDVTVSSRRTALTDGVPTYEVTITGRDIMNHTNAQGNAGHWVGFGMPVAEGKTFTYEVNGAEVDSIAGRTYEANGKTYNTVYFSEENDGRYADYTVVVKDGATVVANYVVKFDVTFWSIPAANVTVGTVPEDHADYAQIGAYALTADQMTIDGYNITLKGELDPAKLNQGTYAYYFLQVKDDVVSKIADKKAPTFEGAYDFSGGQAVATRVLLNSELRKLTHTFTAYDANGRVQDVFEITVDATGCSVQGMKKVTFVDGETVLKVMSVAENGTVALPATPANTETTYYTGKWFAGETEFTADTVVTADITVAAQSLPVEVQATKVRVDGPEGNVEKFEYEKAYTEAGLTLANNVITVDGADLLEYAKDSAKFDHLRGVNGDGQRNSRVVMGVEYTAPTVDGATITKFATAATLDGLASANVRELSSYPENQLISYTDVAKYENGKVVFLDDGKQDGAKVEGEKLDGAPYTKWMDKDGNVLAVTKVVLERKTNKPATYTVTFGTTEVETGYDGKLAEIPAVPTKDGYTGKWVVDGEEVTTDTVFTADAAAEAVYTPNFTVTFEAMSDDVYALYAAADGFKDNIPAFADFGAVEIGSVEDGVAALTGELKAITTPWTGFNTVVEKEQTGYYLLFQFEAPASAKTAEGVIVKTAKNEFTAANLDEVDGKQVFSFIWWLAEPTATALENETVELTIDWDGNGGKTGTKYTLDLSGLTLKAAEATPDENA